MQNDPFEISSWLSHEALEYASTNNNLKGQDLLKRYSAMPCDFFTVILTQQSVDRKKFENTPFILTEYETCPPPVKREAYELMDRKFHNHYK